MRFLMLVLVFVSLSSAQLVMDPVTIKADPVTDTVKADAPVVTQEVVRAKLLAPKLEPQSIEDIEAANVARSELARLKKDLRATKSEGKKRYILAQMKVQEKIVALSQ